MSNWAEISKIKPWGKLKKDPRFRAERMAFVRPATKVTPPTTKEVRQMRDSTRRKRARAQSLRDKETT